MTTRLHVQLLSRRGLASNMLMLSWPCMSTWNWRQFGSLGLVVSLHFQIPVMIRAAEVWPFDCSWRETFLLWLEDSIAKIDGRRHTRVEWGGGGCGLWPTHTEEKCKWLTWPHPVCSNLKREKVCFVEIVSCVDSVWCQLRILRMYIYIYTGFYIYVYWRLMRIAICQRKFRETSLWNSFFVGHDLRFPWE